MTKTLRQRARSLAAVAAAGALTAAGLAACSTDPGPAGGSGDDASLRVVATTTQLADLAGVVGGDRIELTGLVPVGFSGHHYDPTPADLAALRDADVVIANGAGLEEWLDDVLTSSGFSGELVEAADYAHLLTPEGEAVEGHGHDHGHGHDDDHDHDHASESAHEHEHTDASAEGHDHETAGDHDHGHHDVDPHLWTEPHGMVHVAEAIGGAYAKADPEGASDYEANAAALMEDLDALDEWMREAFESVPEAKRQLITTYPLFQYLAKRYHLTQLGTVLHSAHDGGDPSVADIDALVAAMREQHATVIFGMQGEDAKLIERIAEAAGATAITGEQALYGESLGAPGSGADTFVGMLIHNTTTLVESWGGTLPELPERLR